MSDGIIRNEAGEVIQVTHKRRFSVKDCDYEEYMVSSHQLIDAALDCTAELCIRREGQAGLIVAVNGSFKSSAYALDIIEITTMIEKVGNRSRTIGFVIRKIINRGYDLKTSSIKNEVLDAPVVVAEGSVVTVMEV